MSRPVDRRDRKRLTLFRWPVLLLCSGLIAAISCSAPVMQKDSVPADSPPANSVNGSGTSSGGQSATSQNGQSPKPSPQPGDSGSNNAQPVSLTEHLRRGEPAAYSAVASILGLFCTIIVAGLTLKLTRAIRRGQVSQEHVKMVLEIDSELVKSPELWAVHGKKYIPLAEPTEGIMAMLTKVTANAKETEKAAAAAMDAIKTREQVNPPSTEGTASIKRYTPQQLKELALVARYFNMFDFVYSSVGRNWFRLRCQDREEWKAWTNYMRGFFDDNQVVKDAWNEFSSAGIYAKSFTKFVNEQVIGKKPDLGKR
jgi:hypothetical protein